MYCLSPQLIPLLVYVHPYKTLPPENMLFSKRDCGTPPPLFKKGEDFNNKNSIQKDRVPINQIADKDNLIRAYKTIKLSHSYHSHSYNPFFAFYTFEDISLSLKSGDFR